MSREINLEKEMELIENMQSECKSFFVNLKCKRNRDFIELYEKIEDSLIGCGYLLEKGPKSLHDEVRNMRMDLESSYLRVMYHFKRQNKNWEMKSWNDFLGNKLRKHKNYYNVLVEKVEVLRKNRVDFYKFLK